MNDFEKGFVEELQKIAAKEKKEEKPKKWHEQPYSWTQRPVASPEEAEKIRSNLTKELLIVGIPGLAASGGLLGSSAGGKGALIGAGAGAALGGGLAGLSRVIPMRYAQEFEDPTGAYASKWKRWLSSPAGTSVYRGPSGEPEYPLFG